MACSRSIIPIYRISSSFSRNSKNLRSLKTLRSLCSSSKIPPLNEPLPNLPSPPVNSERNSGHVHKTRVTTLENGTKIASEDSFGQFSTVGVLVDAGSRYEIDYPLGLSHIIEKMAFLSTEKYSDMSQFQEDLQQHGGHIDCQAFRDTIIYAGSSFTSGVPLLMDILSEAVLKSNIIKEIVEPQKEVVLFELEDLEYRPDPEPMVTDLIHMAAYRDNTLGLPKLCPRDSLAKITPDVITHYMSRYYHPSRITIAAVNVDHDELVELSKKNFIEKSAVWSPCEQSPDYSIAQYTGGMCKEHRSAPRINPGPTPLPELAHISVGFESVSYKDPDFFAYAVLNTLMGGGGSFSAGGPGKGMYSRLYVNVLNNYHWMYSATAYHHSYSDSGLFCIHASSHPSQVQGLIQVLLKEYLLLVNGQFSKEEVDRSKKQLQSLLMMNLESRVIVFEDIGRQVLGLGYRKPAHELYEAIESVTAQDLRRACERMLASKVSVAGLGDLSQMPSLDAIQRVLLNKGHLSGASRFSFFR